MLGSGRVFWLRVAIAVIVMVVALPPSSAFAGDPPPTPAATGGAVPSPTSAPIFVDPLDPRAGEGASAVGAPLLALLGVLALGFGAAALTYVFVRVTARR